MIHIYIYILLCKCMERCNDTYKETYCTLIESREASTSHELNKQREHVIVHRECDIRSQ